MRKKTVYVILITFGALVLVLSIALGAFAVAFFGAGNGLVAELWGDRNVQHETVDPSDGYVESQDSTHGGVIMPIDPMPPAETQTQSPEIMQGTPDEIIRMDGIDLNNWDTAQGVFKHTFTQEELHASQGALTPDDGFVMYLAADTDCAYFAFEVNDRTVVNSEDDSYDGDHFVISLDLGELNWRGVEPVTYSFGKNKRGCIAIAANVPSEQNAGEEQYYASYNNSKYGNYTRGSVRVKTAIEGSYIVQVAWAAEFALKWDMLIEHLEQNHGKKFEELGLEREKLYAVVEITYVDMDKNGNLVKEYSIQEPLTVIFYPEDMNVVSLN